MVIIRGISPIAVVISATFWTWLWGTVGLVLSTPLTVCLVVLGRHVKRLAFLDVIFGDAPPLTPVENFYQRMLAGDASEVVDQAEQFLKTNLLIDYYDEVALPALLMAQVDLRRGVLDEPRQRRIKETIDEVIEDLSDHVDRPPAAAPASEPFALEDSGGPSLPIFAPSFSPRFAAIVAAPLPNLPRADLTPSRESEMPILCIAGRSLLDEAAAAPFAQILEKHGMGAKVGPAGALTAGRNLAPFGRGCAARVPLLLRCRFEHGRSPLRGSALAPASRRSQNSRRFLAEWSWTSDRALRRDESGFLYDEV